jgi:hypothetical protein
VITEKRPVFLVILKLTTYVPQSPSKENEKTSYNLKIISVHIIGKE